MGNCVPRNYSYFCKRQINIKIMMDNKLMERNIANAKLLLEKAMPSRDFELIDELLSPDAPIIYVYQIK